MVTSKKHIRELGQAPWNKMSLHAGAKEVRHRCGSTYTVHISYVPRHTMGGFEWKNQRDVDGIVFVRALRLLLTSNSPTLLPSLDLAVADQFYKRFDKRKQVGGETMSSPS